MLPTDGGKMNLDYSALTPSSTMIGLGGAARVSIERAVVVFNDPGKAIYGYNIELTIIEPNEILMGVPSLLGRDILNQWRMHYSPSTKRLLFHVNSFDYTLVVPS